mgnify:CR=1 FL=1
MQMEKSQKEYAEKIEQLREEQRKANLEKLMINYRQKRIDFMKNL